MSRIKRRGHLRTDPRILRAIAGHWAHNPCLCPINGTLGPAARLSKDERLCLWWWLPHRHERRGRRASLEAAPASRLATAQLPNSSVTTLAAGHRASASRSAQLTQPATHIALTHASQRAIAISQGADLADRLGELIVDDLTSHQRHVGRRPGEKDRRSGGWHASAAASRDDGSSGDQRRRSDYRWYSGVSSSSTATTTVAALKSLAAGVISPPRPGCDRAL